MKFVTVWWRLLTMFMRFQITCACNHLISKLQHWIFLYRQNYQDPEAPVSFTYSLIFNGTEPIIKGELDDIITSNSEVYDFSGTRWVFIGDKWLINEQGMDEIKINISDYLIVIVTTQPPSTGNWLWLKLLSLNAQLDLILITTTEPPRTGNWF